MMTVQERIEPGDYVTFDYMRIDWENDGSMRHKGAGYVTDVTGGLFDRRYTVRHDDRDLHLTHREVTLHAKQFTMDV